MARKLSLLGLNKHMNDIEIFLDEFSIKPEDANVLAILNLALSTGEAVVEKE